ncbi:MAG TPA: hypothetical protein VGN72_09970 [Tepidisphaeraceae bacterium]|nr:hypothetical protein [Tepidisphaeraceae bacterium]
MNLSDLARQNLDVLTLSTLFEAGLFRERLATDSGIAAAIDWCHANGITRVFLESFRTAYDAPPQNVLRAKGQFEAAGIQTAGGVTPTHLGKRSTGWDIVACYTDAGVQDKLQQIFEDAARLFDLVMIDDFLFTDCQCPECDAARGQQSWSEYRRDLLVRLSRERILEPARRVNPNVKIILKYPQWYDKYHLNGYDVERQTAMFDLTWAGTELRDPDHNKGSLPRVAQYEGFWVMRWLSHLAGGIDGKCGGGWFDEYATSPNTYVEQAWQTVLGGGREMVLFHYTSLTTPRGESCIAALRPQLPAMFELARLVRSRPLSLGVVSPKPPGSDAGDGRYVFDYAGMIGLPLIPTTQLDPAARSAFVSAENLADPAIADRLGQLLDNGGHAVVTDGLLAGLKADHLARHPNLLRVDLNGKPESMLTLPAETLTRIRQHALSSLGVTFDAPPRVAVTLLGDDLAAVSNFGNDPAQVSLRVNGKIGQPILSIPQADFTSAGAGESESEKATLPGRSLTVYRFAP